MMVLLELRLVAQVSSLTLLDLVAPPASINFAHSFLDFTWIKR